MHVNTMRVSADAEGKLSVEGLVPNRRYFVADVPGDVIDNIPVKIANGRHRKTITLVYVFEAPVPDARDDMGDPAVATGDSRPSIPTPKRPGRGRKSW